MLLGELSMMLTRLINIVFCITILFSSNCCFSQTTTNVVKEIPFTNLHTKNYKINVGIDIKNLDVFLDIKDKSSIALHQNLPIKILEYSPGTLIVFTRPILMRGLSAFVVTPSKERIITEIKLPNFLKETGYFREAFLHDGDIYFVNYHPNSFNKANDVDPNGNINKLYRIRKDNGKFIFDEKFLFQIDKDRDIRYGLDRKIHARSSRKDEIILCNGYDCIKLNSLDGTHKKIDLPPGYHTLEMASDSQYFYAILASESSDDNYIIYDITHKKIAHRFNKKIPFGLKVNSDGKCSYELVNKSNIEEFLNHRILTSKDSGLLELGMNNHQARIAWSAVYYLNSFIDILNPKMTHEFDFLSEEFKKRLRTRLDIEIALLDLMLKDGVSGIKSARYSTEAQERVYAVQSGRILRLLKRYQAKFLPLNNFELFKKQVEELEGHEEVFHTSKENDVDNLPIGRISLKWPKNTAFPFDGFNLPFNHQDDWAAGVVYGEDHKKSVEARDMLLTLLDKSGIKDATTDRFEWLYWYGRVSDPWTEKDDLSYNTKSYGGDKGLADISYRVIDVMALLTVAKIYPELLSDGLFTKIQLATQKGLLFPFVQEDLIELYEISLKIDEKAALNYSICDSAWCLANVIWSLKDIRP